MAAEGQGKIQIPNNKKDVLCSAKNVSSRDKMVAEGRTFINEIEKAFL